MKTISTPRDELVCGKLDSLELYLQEIGAVDLIYLVNEIRHDCERMEAKLVSRKLEVKNLTEPPSVDLLKKALL